VINITKKHQYKNGSGYRSTSRLNFWTLIHPPPV